MKHIENFILFLCVFSLSNATEFRWLLPQLDIELNLLNKLVKPTGQGPAPTKPAKPTKPGTQPTKPGKTPGAPGVPPGKGTGPKKPDIPTPGVKPEKPDTGTAKKPEEPFEQQVPNEQAKLSSDREVVKALYRLATIEASSWPEYQQLIRFVFSVLAQSSEFTQEKKCILATKLKDIRTKGSIFHFVKAQNLILKPGGNIDTFLRSFFDTKKISVSNNRLKNIEVNIFKSPSHGFDRIVQEMMNFLADLFYNMENREAWRYIFPEVPVFQERSGFKEVNKNMVVTRIILNILSSQRRDLVVINQEQKNRSDAIFYSILSSRKDRTDRDEAFKEIIGELDWLRINPEFLKSQGMFCSKKGTTIHCPDTALLTFLTEPYKVMKLKPGEASISRARLSKILNAHYFGRIEDDFGVDPLTGESAFGPVKALLTTQVLKLY